MIDKTKIITTILTRLQNLPSNHYLDVRTYKRNRSVLIIKIDNDSLKVIENGFFYEEYEVQQKDFKRLFKSILKKEFPRSTKIRLYTMGVYDEKEHERLNRKKI